MYSNKLICNVLIYINNNITDKITINNLEKKFFYNRYYIMKLFKKEIGITIIEYINSIRIYNSLLQMKNETLSLTSIAIRNGFSSLEYFSETCRQITKLNPRVFKNCFLNKKNLTQNQVNLINNSMVKLYETNCIKDNYLSKAKTDDKPVKKLTLFNFK